MSEYNPHLKSNWAHRPLGLDEIFAVEVDPISLGDRAELRLCFVELIDGRQIMAVDRTRGLNMPLSFPEVRDQRKVRKYLEETDVRIVRIQLRHVFERGVFAGALRLTRVSRVEDIQSVCKLF